MHDSQHKWDVLFFSHFFIWHLSESAGFLFIQFLLCQPLQGASLHFHVKSMDECSILLHLFLFSDIKGENGSQQGMAGFPCRKMHPGPKLKAEMWSSLMQRPLDSSSWASCVCVVLNVSESPSKQNKACLWQHVWKAELQMVVDKSEHCVGASACMFTVIVNLQWPLSFIDWRLILVMHSTSGVIQAWRWFPSGRCEFFGCNEPVKTPAAICNFLWFWVICNNFLAKPSQKSKRLESVMFQCQCHSRNRWAVVVLINASSLLWQLKHSQCFQVAGMNFYWQLDSFSQRWIERTHSPT